MTMARGNSSWVEYIITGGGRYSKAAGAKIV